MIGPPSLLRSRRRRRLLAELVAIGVGQAFVLAATALLVEHAFDTLLSPGRTPSLATAASLGGALTLAAVLGAALKARERVASERLGQHYVHALRMTMYGRLAEMSPRALQRRSQGGVLLRFVGDLTAVRQWVSLGLARLVVAGTFTLGAMVALAWISAALAAAVSLILALAGLGVVLLGRPLQETARAARRRRTRLAAKLSEQVSALGVVQALGQAKRERRHVNRQSRHLANAMIERSRVAGRLRGLTEATAALVSAVVLIVGALVVAAGDARVGTVVAALSVVGLLVSPLRDLGRVPEYWHNSRVSLEKVTSFLRTPSLVTEPPHATALDVATGRLDLEGVQLAESLSDVSAQALPGKVVALVGPNGSGKSTLLAIVARLIDPDAGSVRLDGQDLSDHTIASVREQVGVAGGDFPLMRGTVERNLRYRQPEATAEELGRVAALCGVDRVLAELPHGAATRVAEGGAGLSAGQRQRIMLARALLGDPRLLLLDEADANLDAGARKVVDEIVDRERGRTTVIVVTHRRELVEAADIVWHLHGGRLVETGRPADLLAREGPTAELFTGRGKEVLALAPRRRPGEAEQRDPLPASA